MAQINDDQLVERLVPKILSAIRAKAKAVETIPVESDLEGITSLPAYNTHGEQFKQVLVPLDTLKEPALTAGKMASEAAQLANRYATEAQQAAVAANEFAGKIVVCTEDEYDALQKAGMLDDNKIYFAYEPAEQEE